MAGKDVRILVDGCSPGQEMLLMFDLKTARSHFIFVQHELHQKREASDTQIRKVLIMVSDFLFRKPEFDQGALLSFHRGVWYQRHHKHFHAHLCVPEASYCAHVMDKFPKWQAPEEYLGRLRRKQLSATREYARYRDNCVAQVHLLQHDPIATKFPLFHFESELFSLVWLTPHPRLGVVSKKPAHKVDLRALYYFLANFYSNAAYDLGSHSRALLRFGAHLCLHVSGGGYKPALVEREGKTMCLHAQGIVEKKTVALVGYVQIDERLYLRWLPAEFHETWLSDFKQHPFLVVS